MATSLFSSMVLLVSLTLASTCLGFEIPNSMLLQREKLMVFSPNIINPKFFNFEFGFLTRKKISSIHYPYNAFAAAFLAEESYTTSPDLRAGALGFKGGVILPTQPWIDLFFQLSGGYAKTALHNEPWFGKREKSQSTNDMFFVEAGALYRYKTVFFRFLHQETTVKYFKRNSSLGIGVNF
jgi:hypothetical protein